jgi:hypothetical protein
MHAVMVSVEVLDQDPARSRLHDEVVPSTKQAPGFKAGYWVEAGEGRGQALIVMESEEAANAMAEAIRGNPDGPARILDVRVGEVVAQA